MTGEGEEQSLGFVAVRYVQSPDARAAERAALQLLRSDRKLAQATAEGDVLTALAVKSVTEVPSAQVPETQPGLVFFPAEDTEL